jgi:hypothetical protein
VDFIDFSEKRCNFVALNHIIYNNPSMATTADIKNGMCIELNGKTFSVV